MPLPQPNGNEWLYWCSKLSDFTANQVLSHCNGVGGSLTLPYNLYGRFLERLCQLHAKADTVNKGFPFLLCADDTQGVHHSVLLYCG